MEPRPRRIRFQPAILKARHDGWTADRQVRFITALAATRSITKACRAVGMNRESACRLRGRPEAAEFSRAWDRALERPPAPRHRFVPLHAALRLRHAKVDEADEADDPPDSPPPPRQDRYPRHFRDLLAALASGTADSAPA